jgi:hypothetical protein
MRMFVDRFSAGLDEMKRKDQRDPLKVLTVLARTGRFSCFEASENADIAKTMTALMRGPLIESYVPDSYRGKPEPGGAVAPDQSTYPWTFVRLTEAGKAALAHTEHDA